jgi:hypothetical protein
MSRYRIRIVAGRKYEVLDTKFGESTEAVFNNLELTQQFIEYMNLKERLIDTVTKHISEDIDVEFLKK